MTDQVNAGDQGQQGGVSGVESLGWRAALPDEFKNHDLVKTFTKPGDFVKAALDDMNNHVTLKTEHEGLKTKMANAIFKPGKDAKPEEVTAYRTAMGVPEKPTDYEFPVVEGVENDPKTIEWAQGVFHQAGLSKEQAALIGQSWNGFIKGLTTEIETQNEQATQAAIKEAETKLKAEWGAEYDANIEFVKRGWAKFTNVEYNAFCDETGIGNNPTFLKFIYNIGKAMGEDFSPKGSSATITDTTPGMNYKDMEKFK